MRSPSRRGELDEGAAAELRLRRLVCDPFAPRGLSLAARYRAARLAALRRQRARWGAFVGWTAPDGERAEFAKVDGDLHHLSTYDRAEAGVRLELLARLSRDRLAVATAAGRHGGADGRRPLPAGGSAAAGAFLGPAAAAPRSSFRG